jgi:hypothetical protein
MNGRATRYPPRAELRPALVSSQGHATYPKIRAVVSRRTNSCPSAHRARGRCVISRRLRLPPFIQTFGSPSWFERPPWTSDDGRPHSLIFLMRARTEDVLLAPRFEIDVLSTIVKLVESTRFATILPRIVRHIVRISHPRRPLSAAAETLIDTIADELRLVSSASTRDENASPRASQSNETAAQTRAS